MYLYKKKKLFCRNLGKYKDGELYKTLHSLYQLVRDFVLPWDGLTLA